MPITFRNFFGRLISRLTRWIYNPIIIFLISRKYRLDANYIANLDITKCFEDRVDSSRNDDVLLKRISSAYKKASHDQYSYPEIFRPSNEWLPIYKHFLKEVMQALEECNVDELDKIYRNFWREPCSTGLVGLPVDMSKSYFGINRKISYANRTLYLNDSIHRFNLWKELLGHRYSSESLHSPMIGNPYGYFIEDNFIKSGADYQHFYATRINDLLAGDQNRKVVVEIGGGFGGMAYYLVRDAVNTTYVDVYLP